MHVNRRTLHAAGCCERPHTCSGSPSLPVPKPRSVWPCSLFFLATILPPRPKMEGLLPRTPLSGQSLINVQGLEE